MTKEKCVADEQGTISGFRVLPRSAGRSVWLGLAVALLLSGAAQDARAQEQSGAIVGAITSVDGSGNAAPGCGGAGGGNNLTTLLNGVTGTPGFDDENVAITDRRAAYRYCDALTGTGANGWTGEAGAITGQAALGQAIALAPEEIFAAMDNADASFDIQTSNVARRLSTIRLARRLGRGTPERIASRRPGARAGSALADRTDDGRGPVGLGDGDRLENVLLALQDGINAGDETGDSGLGFFLNGRVHVIKGEENEAERGSDGTGGGFTMGVDKQLDDSMFAGVALGYTRIRTHYDGNGSETDLDAVTVSFYGAWYPTDQIYVDGSISGAWLGLDMTNELLVLDGGPQVGDLQGDTNGGNIGFDIGVGYSIQIPNVEGLLIEPFVRANVLYTEIEEFDQKGGDNTLNLEIDTQKTTSVTGSLGFRTEYAWSTRLGVLSPYFRAAYVREFNKENDDIGASLQAVPGSDFKLKANATDSNYGNFGVGLAASLGQGFSQFIDYDVVAAHENVTLHQITAGIRLAY